MKNNFHVTYLPNMFQCNLNYTIMQYSTTAATKTNDHTNLQPFDLKYYRHNI